MIGFSFCLTVKPPSEEGAILGDLGLKYDAEVGILSNFTFFNWTNYYQI